MLKVATVLPHEPYREYKDVERVYSGSTEIDKILDKNGNVLFAVNKEVEGTPALTYKGKEETNLKNYRIYGQTVDGESVGDKTENLFDKSGSQYGNNLHWVPTGRLAYSDTYYGSPIMDVTGLNTITRSYTGTGANYFLTSDLSQFVNVSNVGTVDAGVTVNVPDGYTKYVINIPNTIRPDSIMVNSGSTALPYEPYGYKVPVTVEGKNLFDENSLISPISSFTWYFDDEHYLLATNTSSDNRAWRYSQSQFFIALSAGTYTLRLSGVGATSRYSDIYVFESNNNIIYSENISGKTNIVITFTLNTHETIGIEIKLYDGKYRIMLNEGSTPLPYEPYHAPITTPIYLPEPIKMVGDEAEYIDYAEQKQHRVRKNLLKNTMTRQIINGVTFTANEDGSITCNGTAGASAPSVLNITFTLPIELYEVSGCPDSGGNSTYRVDIRNNDSSVCNYNGNSVIDNGTGCLFDGGNNKNYCIRIAPGYTCDNLTFYPMIRKADITDDTYEPYIENTEVDVTLPALPTLPGTNTLTVGTEVQPSNIHLKGRIKEVS